MPKGILRVSNELLAQVLGISAVCDIEYALGGTDHHGAIEFVVSADDIPEAKHGEKMPAIKIEMHRPVLKFD